MTQPRDAREICEQIVAESADKEFADGDVEYAWKNHIVFIAKSYVSQQERIRKLEAFVKAYDEMNTPFYIPTIDQEQRSRYALVAARKALETDE